MVKCVLALLLVLVVWTFFLISNPIGWHRLIVASAAIFNERYRGYAIKVWEDDDKKINELLGGVHDHTISGRVGYYSHTTEKKHYKVAEYIIDKLFWFQPNHCYISIDWRLFPKK